MRLVLHREIPADETLRSRWNALVLKSFSPQVFHTHEWALAMSRAYPSSLRPLLMVAQQGEIPIGIAALATDPAEKEVSFLSATTADYCDFHAAREILPEFLRSVLAEVRDLGFSKLSLANLPADSPTTRILAQHAKENGYRLFCRRAYSCARVAFASQEARDSLRDSLRRKEMVRRHWKSMSHIASVALRHLKSQEQVARALPSFISAHVSRFLALGQISNLAQPERRLFLQELSNLLSAQGWLALSALMVGERPVAWNYGFQYAGSWFWYQPAFDTRFERFYPGYCLLAKIIEEATELPEISAVDLGLGDESYKERFATENRATLHVTLTSSVRVHLQGVLRYRAAVTIKKHRVVEKGVRWILGRIRRAAAGGISALVKAAWRRGIRSAFGRSELVFFEFLKESRPLSTSGTETSLSLRSIEPELLADAAMRYVDDAATSAYLVRSAGRLRKNAGGFALLGGDGVPVHFSWVAEYSGFYASELGSALTAPSASANLIYDCWTPEVCRGRGYYAAAIRQLAYQLIAEGREPWIFCAASNISSLRGITKAGFTQKFSLVRKRVLFVNRAVRLHPAQAAASLTGVAAVG